MDTRKLHELGTWRIFSQFNLAMRIKWSEARSQDNTRCSKKLLDLNRGFFSIHRLIINSAVFAVLIWIN